MSKVVDFASECRFQIETSHNGASMTVPVFKSSTREMGKLLGVACMAVLELLSFGSPALSGVLETNSGTGPQSWGFGPEALSSLVFAVLAVTCKAEINANRADRPASQLWNRCRGADL